MASGNHQRDEYQYQNELGIVTRRSFLRGAVGALTTTVVTALMPVSEGRGEPPAVDALSVRHAWAASSSGTFTFKIVSKHEVGIHVQDVATLGDDGKPVPVPGATVELSSYYFKSKLKRVSGETDEKGNIIFDITDLSVYDDEGEPLDGVYQFNGSLVIKSPKSRQHLMREFSTGLVHVVGAEAIVAGTHALDDMSVYPERITFDRWDVHYSENTFFRSSLNRNSHSIVIRLFGVNKDVTVSLKDKAEEAWHGLERTATAKYDADTGLATAEFEGEYLNTENKDDCLPEGKTTLRFSYSYDGVSYWTDIVLEAMNAPIESAAKSKVLNPMFTKPDAGLSCTIPVGVPGLENVNISCWTPRMPFQVSFSPTNVILGVGVDAINGGKRLETMKDTGEKDPNGWMDSPGEYFVNEYEKTFSRAFDKISALVYGHGFRNGDLVEKQQFTTKITWSFRAEAVFGLSWTGENEYANNVFTGSVNAAAQVALAFSYTAEALLGGCIPAYVTFTLNMSAMAAVMLVGTITQAKDSKDLALSNAVWDLGTYDPISVTFRLSFTLTLGLGVKDVISAGVSGTLAITMYLGFLAPNLLGTDKADPHTVVTCEVKVEVFVQLVIFKASATLWSMKGTLEDNWQKQSALNNGTETGEQLWEEGEARFMLTQADGSKRHTISRSLYGDPLTNADTYKEMVIVKDGELASSVESVANLRDESVFAAAQASAQAERPRLIRDKFARVVVLDDGTTETELVDCPGAVTFSYDDDESEDAPATEQNQAAGATEEGGEAASEEGGAAAAEEVTPSVEGETQVVTDEQVAPAEGATPEDQAAAIDDTLAAVVETATDVDGVAAEGAVAATVEGEAVAGDAAAAAAAAAAVMPLVGEAVDDTDASAGDAAAEAPAGQDAATDGESEADAETAADEAAGADGDDEDLLGDPIFGFGVPAPDEYEYVDVSSTTGASCYPTSFKTSIAPHGGIVPTVDAAIYQSAFSDPRQRVVVIGGVPYLFRIITVEFGGAEKRRRTRLAASAFNESTGTWDAPRVISYGNDDSTLPRVDIFDYDFDIVTRPDDGNLWFKESSACIVVTGGLRPAGDGSQIYDVFTSPTITFLLVDANLNVKFSAVQRASAYLGDDRKHMVISPHLLDHCGLGGQSGVFLLSFIHRSAVSADDIMSSDRERCAVTLTVAMCSASGKNFSFKYRTLTEDVKLDPTVTSMDAILTSDADMSKVDLSVTMLFHYEHGYDVYTGSIPTNMTIREFTVQRNVHSTEDLPGLVMWPGKGHAPFLYTRKSTVDDQYPHLYGGTYAPDSKDAAALTESIVDLEGFNGGAFGVSPKGTYLYFIDSRRGNAGEEFDANDTEKTSSTPVRDDVYHIKASKFIDGAFCEDFEFCELTHPIDSLLPISFTSQQSTFITSEIVDADKSLATLSYLVVPHAVVAEVEGFTPNDFFVCAGSPCEFQLTVRNHGNVVISGFDVDLVDPDDNNKVVSTAHVGQIDPHKVSLTPTSRNWMAAEEERANGGWGSLPGGWAERVAGYQPASGARGAAGAAGAGDAAAEAYELSPSLASGQLMPGKTMGYPVTFDIPDYWEGTKTVIVRVRDAWASEDLLVRTGIGDPVTHFHEGTTGDLVVHAAEAERPLVDPEEGWTKGGDDEPDQPDDPTPTHDDTNNDSGGTVTRRRTTTPSMGDPAQLLNPLSMLLGGVGAGLVAYGARRKMVEQEEWERKNGHDVGKDE